MDHKILNSRCKRKSRDKLINDIIFFSRILINFRVDQIFILKFKVKHYKNRNTMQDLQTRGKRVSNIGLIK